MSECIDPPDYDCGEDELEIIYDRWLQRHCACSPVSECSCASFEDFLESKLESLEESITYKFSH